MAATDGGAALLALYDEAVSAVYGYLVHRCRDRAVAEDLTSETFMAAVTSIRRQTVEVVTTAWLIGIARHKLIDHWRRADRESRRLGAIDGSGSFDDPWDVELDAIAAHEVLDQLTPSYRAALTLRYLDDLTVADVAALLGRSLHATEALLVRARRAFRTEYDERREVRP